MPFTQRPVSIYDFSVFELIPAFNFPGSGPTFAQCGTFARIDIDVNPGQFVDLARNPDPNDPTKLIGNSNKLNAQTAFFTGEGPGLVNAPVVPDAIYALRYEDMDVDNNTGTLGLRLSHQTRTEWGRFTPQLRAEYQRDFGGRSDAVVRYADLLGGPRYGLLATDMDRNRFMLGLGAMFDLDSGWGWRLEYSGMVGDGDSSDHGLNVTVQKQF